MSKAHGMTRIDEREDVIAGYAAARQNSAGIDVKMSLIR